MLVGIQAALGSMSYAELESAPAIEKAASPCKSGLAATYPEQIPAWNPQSPYETIYDWARKRSDVDLGIGHVRDAGRFLSGGREVRLPLYPEPDGVAWGWFANGWLLEQEGQGATPKKIGSEGMVETEYEATSLIVFEARPDGWLRFRYGRPSAGRDGRAWLHRCHLEREGLALERWEDRFLSDEISPLFFRHDDPRKLLSRPDDDARRVLWIANDYHLEPLGFKGDWMHVLVKQPSDYCGVPEGMRPKTFEGWVRWRSPERGPLVWYHTRGC
jgi:hypothetical protein